MRYQTKLYFIVISIIIISGCFKKPINSDDLSDVIYLQSAINNGGSNLILKKRIYYIDSQIKLKSNQFIDGNGSTFIIKYTKSKFHVFNLSYLNNLSINNLSIIGDTNLTNLDKKTEKYIIYINNSQKINLKNIRIKNSGFTPIHISDCKFININECHFSNIGLSTANIPEYSYDGIFIGGYKETSDIKITNCTFVKIGQSLNLDSDTPDDGDGIQLQVPNNSKLHKIEISNCLFDSCTARGIKIQSGFNLNIFNNRFHFCKTGIGITMANIVKDTKITNSQFNNCYYAWGTNSNSTNIYADNILFKNNRIENCYAGYRSSGLSRLFNSVIDSNIVSNLKTFFLDGVFENSSITSNKIKDFGMANDPSLYMAILIADKSKNIIVSQNEIKTKSNSHVGIYFQENVVNPILENNSISLRNSIDGNKYFIHLTKKDNTEILKLNKTYIIK